MKRLFVVLMSFCSAAVLLFAQKYSEEDNALIQSAIEFSDNGNADKAIDIYNQMLKKYPQDSGLLYEMAYCHYVKQDFKKAIRLCKKAESMESPGGFVYALHGNSLDNMGKRNQAIKIYKEGISRYPDFGQLYLELGTVYAVENKLNEAVASYSDGIKAEPSYPSNYYRISQILCQSNEPVWGIVYGEIHQLLSPTSRRSEELSELMYVAYNSHIGVDNNGKLRVTLTSKRGITFDGESLHVPFEILFQEYSTREEDLDIIKEKGHLDMLSLAENRKVFLTRMFQDGQNQEYLYPIFKYQQKVLEAGHWEAYNMFLLRAGSSDEFEAWFKEHKDQFTAFARWFAENPFNPAE